jgi:LacI family transcriptional regulator
VRTRERVDAAARQLGYRTNALARSLRTTRSATIGLIVSDVRNPFFSDLVRWIEHEAEASGLSIIVCNADEETERQDRYVDTLLAHRVDGLIATPQGDGSGALGAAIEAGVPTVFVDRRVSGLNVPVVTSDNAGGAQAMVNHLVRVGHSRIGVIAGPQEASTGRDRLSAVIDATRRHGIDLPPDLIRHGNFQLDSGVTATAELLALPEPPTVLFAADNLMALGAFQELRRRGIEVAGDIGLAAFDDLPWFDLVDPGITAVAQDTERMARTAVRMLTAVIEGQEPDDVIVPTELRVRASCGEETQ